VDGVAAAAVVVVVVAVGHRCCHSWWSKQKSSSLRMPASVADNVDVAAVVDAVVVDVAVGIVAAAAAIVAAATDADSPWTIERSNWTCQWDMQFFVVAFAAAVVVVA